MRPMLLLAFALALAACASEPAPANPPGEAIRWANKQIDQQRATKQELLRADPIERRIEAFLNRDPRVKAARFALIVSDGFAPDSFDEHWSYAAVVECHTAMSEDEASDMVEAALRDAGASAVWDHGFHGHGNTWSQQGTLAPAAENPDLSPLIQN